MKRAAGQNGTAAKISGPNVGPKKSYTIRGTGKSQSTSPSHSHKTGGAVIAARGARHPLDNRGKDNDKVRYSGARGGHKGRHK